MKFWALQTGLDELLVDEVVVPQAVSRILGLGTVEALCLFTSRIALDGFMESFLSDMEGPPSRQELEAAFRRELEISMSSAENTRKTILQFPVFSPQELIEVLKSLYLDVNYVVLDPDTPGQQVWSIEQFRVCLAEHVG